jgi:hypothetical protein
MLKVDTNTPKKFVEEYLSKYALVDDSSSYAYARPSQEVYMQVLVLSYQDLNASMIAGMPGDLITTVAEWSGNLGAD